MLSTFFLSQGRRSRSRSSSSSSRNDSVPFFRFFFQANFSRVLKKAISFACLLVRKLLVTTAAVAAKRSCQPFLSSTQLYTFIVFFFPFPLFHSETWSSSSYSSSPAFAVSISGPFQIENEIFHQLVERVIAGRGSGKGENQRRKPNQQRVNWLPSGNKSSVMNARLV